jgi:DNA-binding transcriptional regulator of glucitol operon
MAFNQYRDKVDRHGKILTWRLIQRFVEYEYDVTQVNGIIKLQSVVQN